MDDADADGFSATDLVRYLPMTRAQQDDLHAFRALLVTANAQMNLVGPSAASAFWRRHVLDSAQLLEMAPKALRWADLGAGAGFPGLILAIRLKDVAGAVVHLVESQQKRCRFLQSVVDALALPAQVHWARAEGMKAPAVEIVTARACAPLARLFTYALPFSRQGARGLFLKGRSVDEEVADARKTWRFHATVTPSLSDESGRIVSVEGLARG